MVGGEPHVLSMGGVIGGGSTYSGGEQGDLGDDLRNIEPGHL